MEKIEEAKICYIGMKQSYEKWKKFHSGNDYQKMMEYARELCEKMEPEEFKETVLSAEDAIAQTGGDLEDNDDNGSAEEEFEKTPVKPGEGKTVTGVMKRLIRRRRM